ncbi:helix-turn-helix domain-containing protein [Carnobacterium sp. ISL-102]|uniref:helix-turn-helix domain-containing protein n=1 Tax=Carnobacterium sp. ISL-102 TaxID=2819142 RepID=UPI001BEC8C6B|nr:helix-turn-helix domain-containing protein [Carnobacterium sp. ISL-102]MBT2731660.1 helix-turn-helix domain-containing protein [Carnobacterium sp. ISL-102]
MAQVSFDIEDSFQKDFTAMLTIAARDAIATAKKLEDSHGKEWLKQKEACEWLNISYGTLQLWRSKGLKIATVEGITLISKTEINRFLKENQI